MGFPLREEEIKLWCQLNKDLYNHIGSSGMLKNNNNNHAFLQYTPISDGILFLLYFWINMLKFG